MLRRQKKKELKEGQTHLPINKAKGPKNQRQRQQQGKTGSEWEGGVHKLQGNFSTFQFGREKERERERERKREREREYPRKVFLRLSNPHL